VGGDRNFTRVAFVPFFTPYAYFLWVVGKKRRSPGADTGLPCSMLIASLIRYPIRSRARLPTGMPLIVSLISYPIIRRSSLIA
jgi:hypothetical protein